MKVKIAIITGLFLACASVPRAQENPQNSEHLYDAVIPAAPMMYDDAQSTDEALFPVPTDQSYSAWTDGSSNTDGIDDFYMGSVYPVLFLSEDEARVFTDAEGEETGVIQTAEGETTYLDNMTEGALRYWLEESFSSANEAAAGVGNSNFVQVIFIESPNDPEIDVSDDLLIPEYQYQIVHAPPEWYEWFHPRIFISKWADLWMTETNATPVVLLLIKF